MRSFKKLIAGFSSLVMCLSLVPVGASATTSYLKGDINNDGVVSGTDSLALKKFLVGNIGTNSGAVAERLDIYRDGIIDNADFDLLKQIILGTETSEEMTSNNTTALPSHSTKYYYKYDASTGTQIGSKYSVADVGNISTGSGVSVTTIIGDDDREIDYSNSGVVKLTFNSGSGTGFVIDKHHILTCAHCVYDTSSNSPVTNLKYTIYNSSGSVKATYSASNYHVPEEYQNASSYSSTGYLYDYAIIEVTQDLSNYCTFSLGVARNYITTTNPELHINGYSGYSDGSTDPITISLRGKMVTGSGYLTSTKINTHNIYYDVDIVPGTSGGPLYVKVPNGNDSANDEENYDLVVIGIHSGQNTNYNLAKRIDTNILNFVYNNSELS